MIRYYALNNGFVEQASWTPYCWIDVTAPTEKDSTRLINEFGMPFQFLEYLEDPDERPRIERDRQWILTIVRIPVREQDGNGLFSTLPLGIITNGEIVATVCSRHNEMIPDFVSHTRIKGIDIDSKQNFILRIIYSATYWFLKYLRMIDTAVTEAEAQLSGSVRNEDLLSLMRLQKSLVFFSTSVSANASIIERLKVADHPGLDYELLEDVEIESRQATESVKIYSDILAGTLDTYASVVSNNVNAIMKRMTAISIALMIPTLIASFYGMNVNIDLSQSTYWFWIIIAVSFALTALCVLLLRKLRWF